MTRIVVWQRRELIVLLALFLFSSGCTVLRPIIGPWMPVYQARSPDNRNLLSVEERACLSDCSVRVVLSRGLMDNVVIANRTDCTISFAHASWSNRIVTVVVSLGYCEPIEITYNFESRRFEPVSQYLNDFKKSLTSFYQLGKADLSPFNGDVLKWIYKSTGPRASYMLFRPKRLDIPHEVAKK